MRRRELLLLVGGVMTTGRALPAQQKAMPVIGLLDAGPPDPPLSPFLAAFREGLSETGYIEGKTVAIEYRYAEGQYDRLPALAAELAARKVEEIVTPGGHTAALAAKSVTSTIPIVSPLAVIRSSWASSRVSPGRAATSRASAFCPAS